MRKILQPKFYFAILAAAIVTSAGCGGGSHATASTTVGGGGGGNGGGGTGSNVQAITVNTGPTAAPPINQAFANGAFTSVTVCAPGSTTNCQTIDGILVDTGSPGLRVLSSALTISLPQQTGASGSPIVECLQFIASTTWGPVKTADVTIAGEVASSLPIQVIGTSQFPTIPTACTNAGPPQEDLAGLGANGLLGVGNFAQDCGSACTVSGAQNPGLYYACPAAGCTVTEESLANQVSNPVAFFATDNNGVVIQFPAASGPEASLNGSLIFGIGTQSNNGLGGATVFTADPNTGNFTTTFKNVSYTGFLDTGSNGFFFLDSATTGLPECADNQFFYCPSNATNLSAVNKGTNGATGTVNFTISNADTLFANPNNAVLPTLGGPSPQLFDWGLPFFFGRTVFVSIEGKSAPGGATPYVAY